MDLGCCINHREEITGSVTSTIDFTLETKEMALVSRNGCPNGCPHHP
jgi:hypothetical protein